MPQRPLQATATGLMKASAGALVLAATLAGCALQPPSPPTSSLAPPVVHPRHQHPGYSRTRPSCAWTQVRGVAQLKRIRGRHSWYRFYPGNTPVVKQRHPANASPGDEFTAILKQPLNGPCKQPALVLVKPLP